MGRSNSSGVATHTDKNGNLITFDEHGSEVLLGQDEPIQDALDMRYSAEWADPDPADGPGIGIVDVHLPPVEPEQSEEIPATGGFLVPGTE